MSGSLGVVGWVAVCSAVLGALLGITAQFVLGPVLAWPSFVLTMGGIVLAVVLSNRRSGGRAG
jgi:hypothetical protein